MTGLQWNAMLFFHTAWFICIFFMATREYVHAGYFCSLRPNVYTMHKTTQRKQK